MYRIMKYMLIVILTTAVCLAGCGAFINTEAFTEVPEESTGNTTEPGASTSPLKETTQPPLATDRPPEDTQATAVQAPPPQDSDFVRLQDYLPDLYVELPYASTNNFTKQCIYEFNEPWLRYGTVKKLIQVQERLKEQNLSLKVWDAFRPKIAQYKLWQAYPDPTYVSNPATGLNSHCRGDTVDVTIVCQDGTTVVMPTDFDDFTDLADRDYSDCDQEAAANALFLENIMQQCGFDPYFGEWWHFSDSDDYPVEESFQPVRKSVYYADCQEYIHLRVAPSYTATAITRIPANDVFLVLAWNGAFALVDYRGLYGYVSGDYIQAVV